MAVLKTLYSVGGFVRRALVLGCQPASFDQGMRLSPPVRAAVPEAVRLAGELAQRADSPAAEPAESEVVARA
jgi:hydrogenase maturation protease